MMSDYFLTADKLPSEAIRIVPLMTQQWDQYLSSVDETVKNWAKQSGFSAKSKQLCLVPAADGSLDYILYGLGSSYDWMAWTALPHQLSVGHYHLDLTEQDLNQHEIFLTYLFWGLGSYSYDQYRTTDSEVAQLYLPDGLDSAPLLSWLSSLSLARDLVNTPCADMAPSDLEQVIRHVADDCGAKLSIVTGEELAQEYPAIHAVGKGALQGPRLIDLTWGDERAPKITLVGKGVCFDTGGLNLKPPRGMREMKKDMGGSAAAIALARFIMLEEWPVRLRLLVPAVENAIDQSSYRPGDIIKTRAGISVEVDNTDAEGRLIMCDALYEACTESPDYLIDFATLTGARGIAVGPDYAAAFSNQAGVSQQLQEYSIGQHDLVWPLPLHRPYNSMLSSNIADCQNCSTTGQAGTITAAVFLDKFVAQETTWIHFDIPGSHEQALQGCKTGGDVQAVRTTAAFLKEKLAL